MNKETKHEKVRRKNVVTINVVLAPHNKDLFIQWGKLATKSNRKKALFKENNFSTKRSKAYLKSSGVVHFLVQSYDTGHIVLSEVREVRFRGVQGITFRNEELETSITSYSLFNDLRHVALISSYSFYRRIYRSYRYGIKVRLILVCFRKTTTKTQFLFITLH